MRVIHFLMFELLILEVIPTSIFTGGQWATVARKDDSQQLRTIMSQESELIWRHISLPIIGRLIAATPASDSLAKARLSKRLVALH
jgi:hypothetical protein